MDKRLEDFDLNLIKLLKAVVETRNTHTAAERLGISQTSVSRGVAKLKDIFGEQLFIRKAHGVEPSELAQKLAEASDTMFDPIAKVLDSYQQFDPLEFDKAITIAMNVAILEVHGVGIHQALSKALPKASFNIGLWQDHSLEDTLTGKIDYVVHFIGFPMPPEIYTHPFKDVPLCLVARKKHPILSKSSAWEDIHTLPIARLSLDGRSSKRAPIDELYLSKGYKVNTTLVTHMMPILIDKLVNSDAISFGSTFVSELSDDIQAYPLPLMPQEARSLTIGGGYLRTKRGYPLNQLLHHTIQSYYNELTQPQ